MGNLNELLNDLEARYAPPDELAADAKVVLLVDDSALDRERFRGLLRQLGCRVVMAANGQEALAMLSRGLRPDLVVLDLVMPVKAGIPTLRALRQDERFRRLPVVVLTGRNDPRLVKATLDNGPTDYILKDASADKIRQRLARHLGAPQEPAAGSRGIPPTP